MTRRQIAILVCILCLAGALRAVAIIHRTGIPLTGDEPSYDSIAWNVVSGQGYRITSPEGVIGEPTAFRGPTYVLFVALIYKVLGYSHTAVYIIQALLDVMCCLLAFKITHLLFRRVDVALVGGVLHAVYPQFVLYTAQIMTETVVTALLMLGITGFLYSTIEGRRSWLYIGAIALGLGALSKPILAIIPITFYVATLIGRPRKAHISPFLVQLLIIGLVMTPWIARNYIQFNVFVPGVTSGGMTFWHGVDPPEKINSVTWTPERPKAAVDGLTELEEEKWYYRDAIRIIQSDPMRYLLLQPKKVVRLWFNLLYNEPPSRASMMLAIYHLGSLVLAVIGMRALRPPRVASVFLALLILWFTAAHLVFDAVVRLSIPAWAYILPFTAAGLVVLWASLCRRWSARSFVDSAEEFVRQ